MALVVQDVESGFDVCGDELKDLRDRLARTRCRRVWVGRRRTG
jgi:hypothetical protein